MTLELIFLTALTLAQAVVLCAVIWLVYCYIKLKHTIKVFVQKLTAMNCDELLDTLIAESPDGSVQCSAVGNAPERQTASVNHKRARLAALTAGGQTNPGHHGAMSFKGRSLTPDRVDAMSDPEIEELYARYEARLGAAMSKSLGSSLLRMYTSVASMLLPLPPSRQPELVADLEQDPFVSSALQSACCELYYRYGMYLAPLTAALTTAKHCDWGYVEHNALGANDNDGGSTRASEAACRFTDSCKATCEATTVGTVCQFAESTNNKCENERP